MTAARRLAWLADRELAAVAEGRTEELEALGTLRDAVLQELPARLSPDDRVALEHAAAVTRLAGAHLAQLRAHVAGQLAGTGRTRQAAQAYRASTAV